MFERFLTLLSSGFTIPVLLLFILHHDFFLSPANAEQQPFVPKRQKPHMFYSGQESAETLSWVVKLKAVASAEKSEYDKSAEVIAKDTQLLNLGQIGDLQGYYLFASPHHRRVIEFFKSRNDSVGFTNDIETVELTENVTVTTQGNLSHSEWHHVKLRSVMSLDEHPNVAWHVQQVIRTRSRRGGQLSRRDADQNRRDEELHVAKEFRRRRAMLSKTKKKRDIYSANLLHFNDPVFSRQWHLVNTYKPGRDINVTGVWLRNVTGRGVTIAVIDDGLEWKNPDLSPNYNPEGSFDLNSNDADPSPNPSKDKNHHGTRCAGEIAAVANNEICGVGVAYQARISGIRILDGPMTDDLEAVAFTKKLDVNDVYSCSWGPEDDGKTVDGPQHLAMVALRHGVTYGRHGYGAIYVVASGNGGRVDDNCNYDGYANSIYTVTIGAIDEDGEMPYYGESCASMLAVTYSSGGGGYERSIVTTDWTQNGGTGCTESHSGTSAAAPIVSALIGLMLQARPCLTWRDVQYIIAVTAVKVDAKKSDWVRNAAGLSHSHQHGFGELKAWRMVNTAKIWKAVPWLTLFTSEEIVVNRPILSSESLESKFNVTKDLLDGYYLNTLEYVHVKITLTHERRGDVRIELICPSQTNSVIGAARRLDESKDGFKGWIFSTVRCWGENPVGVWTLRITDTGASASVGRGSLVKWQLQLYGSMMTSDDVAERIRLVGEASSGKFLNESFNLPCPPAAAQVKEVEPISERILKILLMSGCFLLLMAMYETFEYAFCYDDEKKEQSELLQLSRCAQQLAGEPSSDEIARLLPAEDMEMQNLAIERQPSPVLAHLQSPRRNEGLAERDLLLELDQVLLHQDSLRSDEVSSEQTVINPKSSASNKIDVDLLDALNAELDSDVTDSEKVNLLR